MDENERQEIRNEAIEEAATVADAIAGGTHPLWHEPDGDDQPPSESVMLDRVPRAIRDLVTPPAAK